MCVTWYFSKFGRAIVKTKQNKKTFPGAHGIDTVLIAMLLKYTTRYNFF